MKQDTADLPDDVEALRAIIRQQNQIIREKDQKHYEHMARLEEKVTILEEQLRLKIQKLFGRSSEKMKEFENQPGLFDEGEVTADSEEEADETEEVTEVKGHKRKKKGRKPIPENLPHVESVYDLTDEEKQCPCGCGKRKKMGEEVTRRIEVIPQQVVVRKHIRYKYGLCEECQKTHTSFENPVVIAKMKKQLIPGSISSASLLAYIFTAKFVDALPYYRQEKIFNRYGLPIDRTNMSNWQIKVTEKCHILHNHLKKALLSGPYLSIDETGLQVMKEEGRSDTTKSWMWVFRGENEGKIIVYFHYDPSRSAKVLEPFLGDYEGIIQTDGWHSYDRAVKERPIIHGGCWAHVRRNFTDMIKALPKKAKPGKAHEFLSLINKLYDIEKKAGKQGLAGQQLSAYRKEHAGPLLIKIKQKLDQTVLKTPPKGLLGDAVKYALGQWDKLIRYIDHPELHIDNNLTENAIRPFTVGRKNWQCCGSPNGAKSSAFIYSLTQSAIANGLEPYWYLRYLFDKLPLAYEEKDFKELLPTEVTVEQLHAYFQPAE